jgi:hypothetical protein
MKKTLKDNIKRGLIILCGLTIFVIICIFLILEFMLQSLVG